MSSIPNINESISSYNVSVSQSASSKSASVKTDDAGVAAVYEASESSVSVKASVYEVTGKSTDKKSESYKAQNADLINQMKADLEVRKNQLRQMVESMMTKQGKAFKFAMSETDMYAALRSGNLEVDAETIAQAKKDIADDGYWGVEQTSDRIVSFAKALTNGDPTKGSSMVEAFKKGFEAATKAWGDKLPDISQRTYDAVLKKLDAWMNGTEE